MTSSGQRHGAIRRANATAAAAAHRPTAAQPLNTIRSVCRGPNEGAPATAHQTRTAPYASAQNTATRGAHAIHAGTLESGGGHSIATPARSKVERPFTTCALFVI